MNRLAIIGILIVVSTVGSEAVSTRQVESKLILNLIWQVGKLILYFYALLQWLEHVQALVIQTHAALLAPTVRLQMATATVEQTVTNMATVVQMLNVPHVMNITLP